MANQPKQSDEIKFVNEPGPLNSGGLLWVRNDEPQRMIFSDGEGNDVDITDNYALAQRMAELVAEKRDIEAAYAELVEVGDTRMFNLLAQHCDSITHESKRKSKQIVHYRSIIAQLSERLDDTCMHYQDILDTLADWEK